MSATNKDTRLFDLPQHVYVLQLHRLWTQKCLCDATVLAGGREFLTHRLVLSAASRYFEAMFNSGFEECKSGRVDLPDVSSLSMEIILNSVYRQNLELNPDIVDNLLEVAHRLEFMEILVCCETYIIEDLITPANCLYYLKLGEKFDLQKITQRAQMCLLKNFSIVCVQDKFLELSKEALLDYVRNGTLCCESELDVFWAVLRWLKYSPDRKDVTAELLKNVRYGLMLPRELLSEVWKEPLISANECQDLLKNAIEYHSNPNMKPVISESWCQPRCTEDRVVIIGGKYYEDDIQYLSNASVPPATMPFKYPFRSDSKMQCMYTAMLPMSSTYECCGASVQIGHYIFIFGGDHSYASEEGTRDRTMSVSASNTCWRFNSVDCSVDQLNNMAVARINHAAVRLDKNRIIVAGGGNDRSQEMDTCEIYDIGKNNWSAGSKLPGRLIFLAGCSHEDKVYLSGGKLMDSSAASKKLLRYDEYLQDWVPEADMYIGRLYHCMCSVKDKIYVFGGMSYVNDADCVRDCEYYSPETNQWTAFTIDTYIPTVMSSCFVVNDDIYLVGGSLPDVDDLSTYFERAYHQKDAYKFNTTTNELSWGVLPYAIGGSIMAVMPFSERTIKNQGPSPNKNGHRHKRKHRQLYNRSYSRSRSRSRTPYARSRSRSISYRSYSSNTSSSRSYSPNW